MEVFYKKYHKLMKKMCRSLFNIPESDIEDMIQEAMLKAYQSWDEDKGKLSSFILYNVLPNVCTDYKRAMRQRYTEALTDDNMQLNLISGVEVLECKQLYEAIMEEILAVERFEDQRLLIKVLIEEKPYEECNTQVDAPRMVVYRFREQLPGQLKKRGF